MQTTYGISINSYFVAPAPDSSLRGQAAAEAKSNQLAGFPPAQE